MRVLKCASVSLGAAACIIRYTQSRHLGELKRQTETAWLKAICAQLRQEPIEDLQRALESVFAVRDGYRRFNSRRVIQSFIYPGEIEVEGNRIYLHSSGRVPFHRCREVAREIK